MDVHDVGDPAARAAEFGGGHAEEAVAEGVVAVVAVAVGVDAVAGEVAVVLDEGGGDCAWGDGAPDAAAVAFAVAAGYVEAAGGFEGVAGAVDGGVEGHHRPNICPLSTQSLWQTGHHIP